jgi:hypothetical protein
LRCLSRIERYRLNLNHLTLPEIKDFNVLGDRFCFREKGKRAKGMAHPSVWLWRRHYRRRHWRKVFRPAGYPWHLAFSDLHHPAVHPVPHEQTVKKPLHPRELAVLAVKTIRVPENTKIAIDAAALDIGALAAPRDIRGVQAVRARAIGAKGRPVWELGLQSREHGVIQNEPLKIEPFAVVMQFDP